MKSERLAWLLFALNALDAVLTLELVSQGAVESNPIAARLLQAGAMVFLIVKGAMVGAGAGLLLAVNARRALVACCVVYAGVVARSVWLIAR